MRSRRLKKLKLTILFIPAWLWAQQTVAPTTDAPVGPVRGQDAGDYNIVQSWELGYRFATIGGDQDLYRSDVNYGDGIRLLGSSLTVNSRDGHGRWLDSLSLTTQGLGGDPYQSVNLRAEKNGLYEYDMTWRDNAYFNPGLAIAGGQHLMNTNYKWQDHDLTLLPQNWFRIHMGYSRVAQDGPALSTQQVFGSQGPVFPLFSNISEQFNEYRLGGDVRARGFKLTILHRWQYFREDSSQYQSGPVPGLLNPSPSAATLTSYQQSQPYRGQTPAWFGNLYYERKWVAVDARFNYAGGRGSFLQNEVAMGLDRFGAAQNQQIAVAGTGDRPITSGDLNITLFPASRFNLLTEMSVSDVRMNGSNSFTQLNYNTLSLATLNFQFLGIRLLTGSATAHYRFSKKLNVFAGFQYSDRQIRSIEDTTSPGFPFAGIAAEQVDLLRAGTAGFNWMAAKNLQVHGEAEIGRDNNPFTPVSLRNEHGIRANVRYRLKSLSLTGAYQENYNNNSIAITAYSSHARTYSANATWSPTSRVSVDASYSKLHLDTIGGISFFAATGFATSFYPNQQSIYISNIHAANLDVRFAATKRLDLFAGYNITRDAGDGRSAIAVQPNPVTQLLYSVQTFPLTYQSPFARISWRLQENLRFNVGYQYYGYGEDFGLPGYRQGYRAHTGYTSLLWSF